MNTHQTILHRLKNRYRLRRLGELLLLAMGGTLLVYATASLLGRDDTYAWVIAILSGAGLLTGRLLHLRLHRLQDRDIATYLNRQFDQLEDSADLLIAAPETLGPLQLLQRKKLIAAFEDAAKDIEWPQQWRTSLLVLALGLFACWGIRQIGPVAPVPAFETGEALSDSLSTNDQAALPAAMNTKRITVNPPAYTGRGTYTAKNFNLKIPEGSRVNWELNFSGSPAPVMLVFSNGDSTLLTRKGNSYTLSRMLTQSGYYSISWRDRGELKSSDYYKLEIIEDQAPSVAINNQEQFVEFDWEEEIKVGIQSLLTDDYGLTEAYLIATVSKGSGESVKFREERLNFTRPKQFSGKNTEAQLEINTKTLGMEPGDELYYYVEAWDNHTPQRQSNRTETYFLQIRDTSTQMISFEGGLGVDLMPEYFRSQRQIIIDSEKLLAEKAAIEKAAFDTRSNDLAHDQKVLRLRYGQFLGEEFESGITSEPEPEVATAPDSDEEILEKYGHAHDTDNEHNLVEEHGHEHEHEGNPNREEPEESPLEAFVHAHDNMEEATFFIQSVKAKLRTALSMMWDAELHLRMSDPAQSLPYQYRILKLLKEISQDSRIYVHRTGFDAPPVKEEKRLTGALEEITNSSAAYVQPDRVSYPAVREALPLLEQWLQDLPDVLTTNEREILLAAGNELAGAAIEQPDLYLMPLSTLRSLLDGMITASSLQLVGEALWRLLPQEPRSAGGARNNGHGLQEAFIKQLKAQSKR